MHAAPQMQHITWTCAWNTALAHECHMTTVRCSAMARARRLKWYVEAEKTNGRWAMMAVAGILGQELLGVDAKWYEAGAKEYDLPVIAQLPIFFLVMGFLETKRFQGFKETGTVSGSSAIILAARRAKSSSAGHQQQQQ